MYVSLPLLTVIGPWLTQAATLLGVGLQHMYVSLPLLTVIGSWLTQAATLLGVGLQHKTIDDLEKDLKLEGRQLLANFNKVVCGRGTHTHTLTHTHTHTHTLLLLLFLLLFLSLSLFVFVLIFLFLFLFLFLLLLFLFRFLFLFLFLFNPAAVRITNQLPTRYSCLFVLPLLTVTIDTNATTGGGPHHKTAPRHPRSTR